MEDNSKYLVHAAQFCGVKGSAKKLEVMLAIYEELVERNGDMSLADISDFVEKVEDAISKRAEIAKTEKKISMNLKAGGQSKSWAEGNQPYMLNLLRERNGS